MSIIGPRKNGQFVKRPDYSERQTFRDAICEAIDQALLQKPDDFEKLLLLLAEEGYEIKRGKNIAIRGKEQKRFVWFKSLREGYQEEDLIKVISGEMEQNPSREDEAKSRASTSGKKKTL